jgi:hypothetical protein
MNLSPRSLLSALALLFRSPKSGFSPSASAKRPHLLLWFIPLALLLPGGASPALHAQGNPCGLVQNSSFEDDFAKWSLWGYPQSITSDARSGAKAISVQPNSGFQYATDLAVTPGQSVTASAWAKVSGNQYAALQLQFRAADGTGIGSATNVVFTDSAYTRQSATLAVPAGATRLFLSFWNTSNTSFLIDDVCVEAYATGETIPVASVAVTPATLALNTGATGRLTATVSPVAATNPAVTWTSSAPSIATVDASGLVTAVSVGTATLTATTADGGFTASASITVSTPPPTPALDFDWRPVRIGAGGFVTGLHLHPLDETVRYARTDVGNAYRWDAAAAEWLPIIVRDVAAGTGLAASLAIMPASSGVESIMADPSDKNIVYVSFRLARSTDLAATHPGSQGALYRSTDRGVTFTKTGLDLLTLPNGSSRFLGERIAVDPKNGAVIYYGTVSSGLRRSTDTAATWSLVGSGGPASTANVINVLFDPAAAAITVNGQTRTSVVYATVLGGDVFRSIDGGQTWSAISAGTDLSGAAGFSTIDRDGRLYVVRTQVTATTQWDGVIRYSLENTNQIRRFGPGVSSSWTSLAVLDQYGYGFGGPGTVQSLAIDPNRPQRIFSMSAGGSLCRSLDGGLTWVPLAENYFFANTFAWLPQVGVGTYRANGGVLIDRTGRLWSPQGNEGVLTWRPSADDSEGRYSNPRWTIQSRGIEELVAHDAILPPGGGDRAVLSVHDAGAFYIDDPDAFTARQAGELQNQLINNGIGLAYCPNAPEFVVLSASDINNTGSGANYSGYSTDYGRTWTPFASRPIDLQCGQIAVSARGSWGLGADRIVILPATNRPPSYSRDGGATWQLSSGFTVKDDGTIPDGAGMWTFALRQRLLLADPFVPEKFYLLLIGGPLYISTDGGANWTAYGGQGLPAGRFHAQMEANRAQSGDFWFASGWEGSTQPGLYRSTDGGQSFTRNPGIEHAFALALGKGRGGPGDAAFAVFVYGKLAGDPQWGVFCSPDAGASWLRVAYNPAGLFDRPSLMAASWDTFGVLYIGYEGNSFVHGRPAVASAALASWRALYFTTSELSDPTITGHAADPDADGVPNLLEYALARDPLVPDSAPPLLTSTSTSPLNLSVSFFRHRADLIYTVEASSTLAPGSWQVIATDPGQVSATDPVVVSDPTPGPRRFLRLRVTPR